MTVFDVLAPGKTMVALLEKLPQNVFWTASLPNNRTLIKPPLDSASSSASHHLPFIPYDLAERLKSCTATSAELLALPRCRTTLQAAQPVKFRLHRKCWSYRRRTRNANFGEFVVRRQAKPERVDATDRSSSTERTALVWFKQDLRVDDHPGLVAATNYSKVLPLFIFDPVLLAGWSDELLEALRDAVVDLQTSLQNIESDLVIRFGMTLDVLRTIAREIDALDIITEEEVEMELHQLVCSVSDTISEETSAMQNTFVKQWRRSIHKIEALEHLPENYKKFQDLQYPVAGPLNPPAWLPSLPDNIDRGFLPSAEEISNAIASISKDQKWEDLRKAQQTPAEELLGTSEVGLFPEAVHNSSRRGLKGGARGALRAFQRYLRLLESSERDGWQDSHEEIGILGEQPEVSFRALFGNALALGTLSLGRVYQEAVKYEKARDRGWFSPFGLSSVKNVAEVIRDSKAIEWYELLALKSRVQGIEKGFQVGMWRWRGFLIQYAVAGETGPPVVLVHGFGAFWEHWRDNIKGLAESGHRVFALTMLGFGRSEKPQISYTDLVFAELVRDFIIEVVREPAVLVGNSIGGYVVSVVAGLWPSVVKALVLLNSAGRVVVDYQDLKYKKPREKSRFANVGARLLLAYLRNVSDKLLIKCYPTNPSRADSWLQSEVMRASYDPNAPVVLEGIFYLRVPLPLNYYLDRYCRDILVIQGLRDPLHNSSQRASLLQACCKKISVRYVNAGHCPHDEVAEDVNMIIVSWLRERLVSSYPDSEFADELSRSTTIIKDPTKTSRDEAQLLTTEVLIER